MTDASAPAITAAALFLGLLFLWIFLRRRTQKKNKRYAPLFGFTTSLIFHFPRFHDYIADQARRSKCFRLLHIGQSYVYLADPRDVEHILSTNFGNYGKGWSNQEYIGDLLGDGIFAADGDSWRQQRKFASHEFTTRNLRDFSSLIFKRSAITLAEAISKAASEKKPLDIQDLLMKATMDSIFKIAFGVDLNTLGEATEESARFSKAFDHCSEQVFWRYVDVTWKIKRALNVGGEAALRKNIRVVDDFVYKIIEQKIEQMNRDRADLETRKDDLLSRFLVEREKSPEIITRTYLRDIILNMVIAGKDTTASALSWFIYRMCKQPDVQTKVAEELDCSIPESSSGSSMAEFADKIGSLDTLPYLHAALNETLRLHPPVPEDPKMCFSDDTLPSGYDVNAGDIIIYTPYGMGRLEELWGADAQYFRPERWLDEDGTLRHESPFKFTAFQAGPRICIGKEFAYRQMTIFVAVLLHFFEFEIVDHGEDIRYRTMMTLHIKGLRVLAKPRDVKANIKI
ncbi:cytochrome P450 704C1-like isoform X2 [Wolffia australiana]